MRQALIGRLIIFVLVFCGVATNAHAYIGPGLGLGAIAISLGVVASLFLVVVATVWYPIKRWIRRWKKDSKVEGGEQDQRQLQ